MLWSVAFGQQWSAPVNVSNSVHDSKWGQCAFGPDSILHIAWAEEYIDARGADILYTSYDGKSWTAPIKLKDSRNVMSERPYIACSSKGKIAVAWAQEGQIFVRCFDPETAQWEAAVRVSPSDEDDATMPHVAVDADGNVYIYYYTAGGGSGFVNSKISGSWEGARRISHPEYRAQMGSIVAASDGTIWVVWIEKMDDGNYKTFYSRRTKSTAWREAYDVNFGGGSQAIPHMAVGKDNIPRIIWMDEATNDAGGNFSIIMCTLNERDNPMEYAINPGLQHYPRIAIDSNNVPHVAVQDGPGDFGGGILYTNKIGGYWKAPYLFPNSGGFPKLPGISCDGYGNVAVVWETFYSTPQKEIWMSSLYPIVAKHFLPPLNLSSQVTIKGIKANPEVSFNLSWQANPENNEEFLSGYNIYKKEGTGNWVLYGTTLTKETFNITLTFNDANALKVKRQFGIKTVSVSGAESSLVTF